ncbi:hypothetical protein [Salipiger abyssi]|uniref:hypothetical protein n=1 Tax=Salipiger abyssi TaxID=1250539 RepID=UPI00361E7B78
MTKKLVPTHNMVQFGHVNRKESLRFSNSVAHLSELQSNFDATWALPHRGIGSAGWHALPPGRNKSDRVPNQGMKGAMQTLNPASSTFSAGEYAKFLEDPPRNYPLVHGATWHWCHLISHGLGGGNGPGNVVAGTKQNNGEQMAIENALALYRSEQLAEFSFRVRAINTDIGPGRHMGKVICYEIRCETVAPAYGLLSFFLDCQPKRHTLTPVHFYTVYRDVVRWMNRSLERSYKYLEVSPSMRRRIRAYDMKR